MATRRPHRKSRNGCVTCKKRRVKCDEAGPPCGPCRSRSIACEYADTKRLRKPSAEKDSSDNAYAIPSIIGAEWSASRRLLELELLHQWSTVTYKSYCGTVEEEYSNWQVVVPRLAMQHDCLLHAILAMSALEIAAFSEDDIDICNHYVDIALEYHNLASSGLRMELTSVTSDNRQATFASSSILMVLGLALPRFTSLRGEQGNYLDHVVTYMALLRGLRLIVDTKEDFRHSEPLLANYRSWESLTATKLEPELQMALQDIAALNEELYGAARTPTGMSEDNAIRYHAANRRALYFLQSEFEKCRDSDTRAYALGWPLRAGTDYMAAVADQEPVALVILMAWSVLAEQVSQGIWWMEEVGRRIISDVAEMLELAFSDPKLLDAVRWAKSQVQLGSPGLL